MAVSIGKRNVNLSDLLTQVTELELLHYYFGIKVIPSTINSPLRKDNHPSLCFYSKDGQKVLWTDHATKESGGIFDLLSRYWGLNFQETLNKISLEVPYIAEDDSPVKLLSFSGESKGGYCKNTEMKCQIREWMPHDIEYWESYGISLPWLKFADIYPVAYKIIVDDGNELFFPMEKYAYAYVEFKEGKVTLKIYQPFSKTKKWANKHDRSVISLWTKVPEFGEKICICSSMKDALCLWANTGIPAIAPQGEGYIISETAQKELKRRYRKVYILFDNDETGLKDGKNLSDITGFTNIVLPQFEGGKDVSDLMKVQGKEKFRETILPLFN